MLLWVCVCAHVIDMGHPLLPGHPPPPGEFTHISYVSVDDLWIYNSIKPIRHGGMNPALGNTNVHSFKRLASTEHTKNSSL